MTSKGVDVSRVYGEARPPKKDFGDVFQVNPVNRGNQQIGMHGYQTMDKIDKPSNSKRSINSKSSSYLGLEKNQG